MIDLPEVGRAELLESRHAARIVGGRPPGFRGRAANLNCSSHGRRDGSDRRSPPDPNARSDRGTHHGIRLRGLRQEADLRQAPQPLAPPHQPALEPERAARPRDRRTARRAGCTSAPPASRPARSRSPDMQGVVRSFDPGTGEGVVVRDRRRPGRVPPRGRRARGLDLPDAAPGPAGRTSTLDGDGPGDPRAHRRPRSTWASRPTSRSKLRKLPGTGWRGSAAGARWTTGVTIGASSQQFSVSCRSGDRHYTAGTTPKEP